MKKVILFGATAVFALSMASCSKDHTCTCKYEDFDPAMYVYPKSSKKSAEEACKKQQDYEHRLGETDAVCSI